VPDVFTKKKRSQVMAAIRSTGNKETEMKFASILRAADITGWRRHLALPGRPDFVFQRERIAVFVDGCFWHGCPKHGRKPGSNANYWLPKLARNRERDKAITTALRKAGWTVLRFWDHQLKSPAKIATKVTAALTKNPCSRS
jgi:DNA mismatch endonuclease (patch repair protein)